MTKSSKVKEMLAINVEQKKFYEDSSGANLEDKGNRITQIWRAIRRAQIEYKKVIGLEDVVIDLHKSWMGDISGLTVLDLGCYSGNSISLDLAKESEAYLGLDLSENAIEILNRRIKENNIHGAIGLSGDFLSEDFLSKNSGKFDLIYAHSVMHHFRYFDEFLERCKLVLKDGGRIVSFDPLSTNYLMRLLRFFYKPFQSDKSWEFPFEKRTLKSIANNFNIINGVGVMGLAKLGFVVFLINRNLGERIGRYLVEKDLKRATYPRGSFFNCLQCTLLIEKS